MTPWNYDISPDRRHALIVDDEGFTVAEITGHTDMTETVELMTAAPDMLEALRDAVGSQPADSPIKWVIRARAAIAKATYTMERKA